MAVAVVILDPHAPQFQAKGLGPASAREDTNAFLRMTRVMLADPSKKYRIKLRHKAVYCLGFGLDLTPEEVQNRLDQGLITKDEANLISYRCGWLMDGLQNVEIFSDAKKKADWPALKTTPGDFPLFPSGSKPTVHLMFAGRTKAVSKILFNRVILDGSASASNFTMDTQQSNLLTCGVKGVVGLTFGKAGALDGVIFRDAPADGVKTVAGTKKVVLRRVYAEKMGRGAIVLQSVEDVTIEDCDGDENFKAWLDAEPTSGDGPKKILIRRTKLHCGVTIKNDVPRRPEYPCQLAGVGPTSRMTGAVVEDCSVDSGTWLYNAQVVFRRCQFRTLHADVPGSKEALRLEEFVEAEFFDCTINADDVAVALQHHNSVGNVPSKVWFHGGTWTVKDRALVSDSGHGIWLDGVTIHQREPSGPPVRVTGTLKGQELTGFRFTNVNWDRTRPLCDVRSKDDAAFDSIKFHGLLAEGCGANPFVLTGRVQNIDPPTIKP